ncbi:MAG: orotate phosphoribosyltransferase, partial [Holophagales bacterium]|nr:orotate phosphoribosyltransferase [Holophagales bacterium]
MASTPDELRVQLTGPLLSRLRQAIALLMWERGAIKVSSESPFLLASGNHSPIYVDCRRVISDPSFLRFFSATAVLILERRGAQHDVIAGGETAGIPYGSALAISLGMPLVYVRKKPKSYGTASRVEGSFAAGSRVLLVEDLITDGGSKLGFLEAIEEAEGKVTD